MKKLQFVHTLSVVLACLILVNCASQSADPPLVTLSKTDTINVTSHTATSTAITTDESAPVTTTGSGMADSATSTIAPETTKETPITDNAPSESETLGSSTTTPVVSPSATPDTSKQDPKTDPPVSSQTPSMTPEHSQKPETSKTPATSSEDTTTTTTKRTSSQTPVTSQTPETSKKEETPTPHTHGWSAWNVTKAATCTTDGSQRRTCSGCNEVQTQTIPATGHSWGNWIVTKEPTITAEGIETRTCSKCKNTETRKIDKLLAENATPEDCEWMAEYFLQLYNEERAKLGAQQLVTDAKMHEMAQVRADELAVSFDHFRPDGRNGGTIFDDFKYGIYHDFTVVGLPASYNYYEPEYANEAIGAYIYSGSITPKEFIVQSVLGALKNHEAHWSYMKDDVYGAVGIAVSAKKSEESPGYYEFYFEVLLSDRLYN